MKYIYTILLSFILSISGFSQVFDTTGVTAQPSLLNSYTSWSIGAFEANRDTADDFDFGWGYYDILTHTITGDSIYIIKTYDGNYKAISIDGVSSGIFTLTHSDLDGSNKTTVTLDRANFPGKNFMYFKLDNGQSKDLETVSANWDVLFTKYPILFAPGLSYPVMGLLHNIGVEVSKVPFSSGGSPSLTDTLSYPFSDNISTIGYDWKDAGPQGITVYDTVAYFVKDQSGNINELIFTAYGGSGVGTIDFTINGVAKQVNLTPGNVDQVYYSLQNGSEQGRNSDHDWDLALSARSSFSSIPVRINDTYGVELFIYPNGDITIWSSIQSVESDMVEISMHVFPQPAVGNSINLVLDSDRQRDIEINLLDMQGRMHFNEITRLNTGINEMSFDIDNLDKGLYFIKLSGQNFKKTQKVFID